MAQREETIKKAIALALALALAFPMATTADARERKSHKSYTSKSYKVPSYKAPRQRSRDVTRQFQRMNPCPSTGRTSGGCPGYVKDHIVPLKRGGPDSPSNLQWQTKEAAKAKDRWE